MLVMVCVLGGSRVRLASATGAGGMERSVPRDKLAHAEVDADTWWPEQVLRVYFTLTIFHGGFCKFNWP